MQSNHIIQHLSHQIKPEDFQALLGLAGQDRAKLVKFVYRRISGEPLAYIKGCVEFFGRDFKVDRRCYIPNPETENLVELLLKELPKNSLVLDVGTGNGALAITIKKERPDAQVFASDIDPNALEVAKENILRRSVDIELFESCYVNDLTIQQPDCIISDMPYGDPGRMLDTCNLDDFKHMPNIALFHPHGVLSAYQELVNSIQKKGWHTKLFIETGMVSQKEFKKIIPQNLSWQYIPFKNYSATIIEVK